MEGNQSNTSIRREIWHFLLHLRWHYQVFILSGGFLLGGLISPSMNWSSFLLQFANVHLLLFGGATAFNSYWDKDEGPIGGLKNPPPMKQWMWFLSILIQAVGLLIAIPAGNAFVGIYALSMLLFWLYSTPHARWKGDPIKSLVAIGISTGTNSLLMGYLAAGMNLIDLHVLIAALGVALVVLSLYPTSQLYQIDDDRKRGDRTFAIKYGFSGVFNFFVLTFSFGVLLITVAISGQHFWLSWGFLFAGFGAGYWVQNQLRQLTAEKDDYELVMRIKFGTSFLFVCFLIFTLLLKHTNLGIVMGLDVLLQ